MKYLDKGVCKHLIAACLMTKTFLHGLVQLPTLLEVIRKRKIRQYRDDSRVDEELVDPIVEPAPETMTEAISEPTPESMAEAIGEQIDPKKGVANRNRKQSQRNSFRLARADQLWQEML
jgi:hypothetical protein